MANAEIRQMIKEKRLKHYEVASALGIADTTFCRWLRTELPEEWKAKIKEVINEL